MTEPTVWWHAEPGSAAPGSADTASDLRGEFLLHPDGAFMLEWILPTLSADRAPSEGRERRRLRRSLREAER
ncbi:MAG TPA: hypothetical protein VHA07_10475 [Devosia sp.]|nr:hypothetical protein [Devosia sp.]